MKTPTKNHLLIVILTVLPLLAHAVNLTWDANTGLAGAQDGSGTWDTNTANWWNGTSDVAFNNNTPDAAFFGAAGGTAGTVTLGTNVTPFGITFNAASVGNYTIAGGGFTLGLTNRTVTANVSATIGANIVGGPVTLASAAANQPSAVLTLSGNNTFAGFNVGGNNPNSTAAVRINSATALGTPTTAIGIAGGQGSQTSHRIELTGSGMIISNSLANLGRNNQSAVLVNLGTGNVMAGLQTKTTGGQDTHWASEVANGITFSGAANNGGAFTSAAGAPRNFVFRGTGGGTISGVISNGTGANNMSIVKAGSGTWTLSGANTYTNATIVDEGTLVLDYTVQNNSKLSDIGPLTLAGGTLQLAGGTHAEIVGSTVIGAGNSRIANISSASPLRMNAITRNRGGVIDFGASNIADTDTLNVNGILGGYATVGGTYWAMNSTGGADGLITAYTGYTDIAATGSTIADGAATNVRLNSAGGGGNIALGSTVTTVQTLLQNTTTAATIDTASKTLRLGTNGAVLLPNGQAGLTIGASGGSGNVTAGGSDNTAGELILINYSASDILVNAVVADNGTGPVSLTKAGNGTTTLASANTHTGTNFIVGGVLNVSADNNFGTDPGVPTLSKILINGGILNATETFTLSANRGLALGPTSRYGNGTISVASTKTLTVAGIIGNADTTGNGPGGSLTKIGPGILVLGGNNTYSGNTYINGGTVQVSSDLNIGGAPGNAAGAPQAFITDSLTLNGGTLQATAGFTLSQNRGIRLGSIGGSGSGTIAVDASQTLTFNGQLQDNWNGTGSFVKTGDGALILGGGLNDYSGDTTVSAGTLQLNNSRSLPNGAGKGNVSVASGATLAINGVNVAINGLSGSGTVDNVSGTPATFSVGNNGQPGSFSGTIGNTGGGQLALAKDGSGTLTLSSATANHSGSTLVRSGTLALTGSTTIASTTNIAVSSGATLNVSGLTVGTLTLASGQMLSGVGSVVGNINSGTGAIAPGTSAGTLPITGNLTLGSGSSLNYELANVTTVGSGVNDLITVSGNLNVAGPTTLNLTYLNALPASSGKYTLITYTGTFSGNVNDISVPPGFTINHNSGAKAIELLINHTPANLTWRGDGASDIWDIDTTPNWIQAGSPVTFFNGDTVTFDNSGSNTPPVYVAAPVIAAAVNVNASQTYDFTGSSISAATLSKSGAGTLILENENLYASGGIINGGTVQVGNAGTTGFLGGGTLTNNAALVFNRADGITITNQITGSGSLTQISASDMGLNASNSYAGLTTVAAGRLFVANGNSLGSTASGTVVSNGAELFITLNVNVDNEPLTLIGSGTALSGALHKGGAGVTTYGGAVSLLGDTMFNIDGGATLNLTNAAGVNGIAANANLELAGSGAGNLSGPILLGSGAVTNLGGVWTVAASNNYAGNTVISGGRYHIASPLSLGTQPGAWTPDRVLLAGGALGVTNDVNVALNDGRIGITLSAIEGQLAVNAGATLTVSNEISGTGNLAKWSPGLLILNGSNSFTGEFYTDGNSTSANDGTTRITRADALQNVTAIGMRNNNGGFSTLQLDGSAGNITLPQPMTLSCRNNTNLCLQNLAGSNVLTGGISIQVGGADQWWQSDSGTLVYAGDINYAGALTGGRNYHFQGAGNHLVTGNINVSPLGSPIAITKDGTGTLTLTGANTYGTTTAITNGLLLLAGSISHTGAVYVVGGTLGGNGSITAEAVNVLPGGTLSPGASIGTLTVNGNLSLAGTTYVELNKTANTNDFVTGVNVAAYGGTLVVTNQSGTLTIGNTFQLFSSAFSGGNFANIVNQTGNNNIGFTFTPASGILTVVAGTANYPTNITSSLSGNNLSLSWPSTHAGWVLQTQTNSLNVGIVVNSNAWFDVAGSTAVIATNITINPANPTVFFRLRHP